MLACRQVQELLSARAERTLEGQAREEVDRHIENCEECAFEYETLRDTIHLLHSLPPVEPVIDLWDEFEPVMAEWEAERKLGLMTRLVRQWERAMAHIAHGAILYTHVLALSTSRRLGRYLITDPFAMED
jgi:anti-sigma factor RsiW